MSNLIHYKNVNYFSEFYKQPGQQDSSRVKNYLKPPGSYAFSLLGEQTNIQDGRFEEKVKLEYSDQTKQAPALILPDNSFFIPVTENADADPNLVFNYYSKKGEKLNRFDIEHPGPIGSVAFSDALKLLFITIKNPDAGMPWSAAFIDYNGTVLGTLPAEEGTLKFPHIFPETGVLCVKNDTDLILYDFQLQQVYSVDLQLLPQIPPANDIAAMGINTARQTAYVAIDVRDETSENDYAMVALSIADGAYLTHEIFTADTDTITDVMIDQNNNIFAFRNFNLSN